MNEDVFDLFGIPVSDIPDGAILSWDWCKWIFIERPDVLSPLACPDVVDCVQPEIDNLWAAVNGKLECLDLAACPIIIGMQSDITALPATVLGSVAWSLQTNNDGVTSVVNNGDTVEFNGINWLSCDQNVLWVVTVSLPAWSTTGDIMTRDDVAWTIVRQPAATNMATLISQSPEIQALKAQIISLQDQINSYHP